MNSMGMFKRPTHSRSKVVSLYMLDWRGIFLVLVGGAASWFAWGGEPPRGPVSPDDESPTNATPYVFGVKSCRGCHGQEVPEKGDFTLVEARIWDRHDPHRFALDWGRAPDGAFRSAAGARAFEIGARLGIEDVTKSDLCIGCHSVAVEDPKSQQAFSPLDEGVTCVACHGAHVEWVKEHWVPNQPSWRDLTRSQKWQNAGMVDLWNPLTRADACLSCHVGVTHPQNRKQMRHDFYEAGHPPLPPFELAAFTEQEVPHWIGLRCKSAAGKGPKRLEQTELVMASALATVDRALEAFADDTGQSQFVTEYARFDCASCHHDLRKASDETWSGTPGSAPGRPTSPRWMMVLAPAVIEVLQGTQALETFEAKMSIFRKALAARPFGDPVASAKAAAEVREWLKASRMALEAATLGNIEDHAFTIETTRELMRRIATIGASQTHDFDSTRQLAWALRALWNEYAQVNGKAAGSDIDELIARLDAQLGLEFRGIPCSDEECPDPAHKLVTETRSTPIVGDRLGSRLQMASRFQPGIARECLAQIADLLRKLP